MPQAIMDPEQVRRFADELKRFNTELQDRMSSLQGRFAALADTWQDQEAKKFNEEFTQTLKALKNGTRCNITRWLVRAVPRFRSSAAPVP